MIKKGLFLLAALFILIAGKAAPGDTTWVQTFSFDEPRQASWTWKNGTFFFPIDDETSYEKVLMYYKIKCDPAHNPACGEWDFLVHTKLHEPIGTNDTGAMQYRSWELAKYITPYGYGLDMGSGWTWIYDVTDFQFLFRDSVRMSDMNFQEMIDIRFAFIEGTPARNLIETKQVWQRDVYLRDIETIVRDTTFVLPENVKQVKLRSTVTGHEFDNATNCAEFCPKIHSVYANGAAVKSWQIIEGCARNPLYPQGGTWIYDRAGWCPGAPGTTVETDLTPYIQNQSINFKYHVANPGSDGYYNMHIELVMYDSINFSHDATVQAIHAPNNEPIYSRMNPTCHRPIVVVKNIGSENLTSLTINYGIKNSSAGDYTVGSFQWEGNLPFMGMDTVELPLIDWNVITEEMGNFFVELTMPNGQQDPTPYNSLAKSNFNMPEKMENWFDFQIYLKTNHRPLEVKWEVSDAWGPVHAQSGDTLSANTIYKTPMVLTAGCYKIQITDSGEDGLKFWANMPPYGSGTSGIFRFNQYAPAVGGEAAIYTFNPDFGAEATEYFAVSSFVGIKNNEMINFEVYPNPASDFISVESSEFVGKNIILNLFDMYGKKVWSAPATGAKNSISVKNFPNGLYILECTDNTTVTSRKKVSIQR